MKNIILASTSPRRKQLLEQIGLPFVAVASDYEEDMTLDLPPQKLAEALSLGKALAVAKNYAGTDSIVIAADTFVVLGNSIMGKPKTQKEAREMLRRLSGKIHFVVTGYTIIDTKRSKALSDSVVTEVKIKDLSDQEIKNYVVSLEVMDKAGAYAIQGKGALITESINGDYYNVMGLPLCALATSLRQFDVAVL